MTSNLNQFLVNGNQATPLYNAGLFDTVMFINTDVNNAVLLSSSRSLNNGSQDINTIPALGSLTMDGRTAWYGITLNPGLTAMVEVAPGGSSFAPSPAQIIAQLVDSSLPFLIAEAVKTAGVPPTDNPVPLVTLPGSGVTNPNFNQLVAAGGSFTINSGPGGLDASTFQSWVGKIFASATASGTGTTPYVRVTFNWSLKVDNSDPLHVEDWVIATGPFSFFSNFLNHGQGPCYGDTLSITFTNYDTQPVNITYGLFGSFRTRIRPILRSQYNWLPASSLPNEALGLGSDSILASANFGAIPNLSSSPDQLINLFDGPVTVAASVTPTTITTGWKCAVIRPQTC